MTPTTPAPTASPDLAAITLRQRDTWSTGDYHVVALTIVPAAEALVESADPHPRQRVLDVACGSGNVALVAARRYCDVTGVDYAPGLLDRARRRAAAEGTSVDFREADAQHLPFPNDSFDVVLSCFGVMFAPDQERAAAEMLRVCRPGGRIGLSNWTPDGFGGAFFATVSRYNPPPPGLRPASRWGTEAGARELLGHGTSALRLEPRRVVAYYPSVNEAVEMFRQWFGPVRRAFEAQDDPGRRALAADIAALFQSRNRATDGTAALELDYVQVLATVK